MDEREEGTAATAEKKEKSSLNRKLQPKTSLFSTSTPSLLSRRLHSLSSLNEPERERPLFLSKQMFCFSFARSCFETEEERKRKKRRFSFASFFCFLFLKVFFLSFSLSLFKGCGGRSFCFLNLNLPFSLSLSHATVRKKEKECVVVVLVCGGEFFVFSPPSLSLSLANAPQNNKKNSERKQKRKAG